MFILIFLAGTISIYAQTGTADPVIKTAADKIEQKMIGWRRDIHENPELVTYNDPMLTEAVVTSLKKSFGGEHVMLIPPYKDSEDFSFFSQKVPGFYFYFGGLPRGKDPKTSAPHHTPDFYLDESGFKTGLIAMLTLVLEYPHLKIKK
ncbi:M20/M25/M40 family metallo-hydrolase [Pollutibacter soli]|uniref:M20/M25/M40 family metallo-hydrolase n=1 Tax=Pollutibacter soli TaxID=3034157 RepID=UPI0030135B1C